MESVLEIVGSILTPSKVVDREMSVANNATVAKDQEVKCAAQSKTDSVLSAGDNAVSSNDPKILQPEISKHNKKSKTFEEVKN